MYQSIRVILPSWKVETIRVLALDANATSAPSGPHNNERNDLIASVNEALKLHRGVLEGLAPVRQPLREPGEAVIGARIRDVVVVDLNLTVDDIPKRLTSPVEVVMEAAGDFDVLLRLARRSISRKGAAFRPKRLFRHGADWAASMLGS